MAEGTDRDVPVEIAVAPERIVPPTGQVTKPPASDPFRLSVKLAARVNSRKL